MWLSSDPSKHTTTKQLKNSCGQILGEKPARTTCVDSFARLIWKQRFIRQQQTDARNVESGHAQETFLKNMTSCRPPSLPQIWFRLCHSLQQTAVHRPRHRHQFPHAQHDPEDPGHLLLCLPGHHLHYLHILQGLEVIQMCQCVLGLTRKGQPHLYQEVAMVHMLTWILYEDRASRLFTQTRTIDVSSEV